MDGTIFRRLGERSVPLLTLDPAVVAPRPPEIWEGEPGSRFRIDASTFRHVLPSPDGRLVAWEAGGVHDLLGVIAPDGTGEAVVLDFFFGSAARDLAWAPAGRYLAAFYAPPSGLDQLRVYDTATRRRLVPPWEADCRPSARCEVSGYQWLSGSTLRVRTTAPGAAQRSYDTDVSSLGTASPD